MINHKKYTWKILKGINSTVCFEEEIIEDKVKIYLHKRMSGEDIGGVWMPTEKSNRNGKLQELADRFQHNFPRANIIHLDKSNAKDYPDLKQELSDPNGYTDIDLLIASPVWGAGINIKNKFSLSAGWYFDNPKRIHDGEALFNFQTRERHAIEHIAGFNSRIGALARLYNYNKIFHSGLNEYQQISKIISSINASQEDNLTFDVEDIFESDYWGNRKIRPEWKAFIDGFVPMFKDTLRGKANAISDYISISEHYGANVSIIHKSADRSFYESLIDPKIKIYTEADIKEAKNTDFQRQLKTDLTRTLGGVQITLKNISQIADPLLMEERIDRRAGNISDPELHQLIDEIQKLTIKINEQMIITNPQFILSKTFKKLIGEDKSRIEALLKQENWELISLFQELNAPLRFLEKLLREWNYYTLFKPQRGFSTQRAKLLTGLLNNHREKDPKTGKKGKIIKGLPNTPEHLTEFKQWKEDCGADFLEEHKHLQHPCFNGKIQSLTYPLYLWNGLNKGIFTFDDLGEITKQYIQTFPHLVIEDYEIGTII